MVIKFSPLIAAKAQAKKKPTAISWRMDETCIKVRRKWTYLYRAVDRDGQTLDFRLSEHRDTAAARRFFKRAVGANGVPERIAIDKSGANLAGLQSINVILEFTGAGEHPKAWGNCFATLNLAEVWDVGSATNSSAENPPSWDQPNDLA